MQNKGIKTLALAIVAVASCLFVNACGSNDSVKALSDGYEEVTFTHSSILNEPVTQKTKLGYKNPEGKRFVIWPVVRSDIFIREGVAVFVGDRALKQSPDHVWWMWSRIFAVKAPEPPVDITSETIGRWARDSGMDVSKVVGTANLIGGQATTDNKLAFYFEFDGGIFPGTNLLLGWNQVLDIMRDVKVKGVQRKDPELGATYLEKEFKPEVRK